MPSQDDLAHRHAKRSETESGPSPVCRPVSAARHPPTAQPTRASAFLHANNRLELRAAIAQPTSTLNTRRRSPMDRQSVLMSWPARHAAQRAYMLPSAAVGAQPRDVPHASSPSHEWDRLPSLTSPLLSQPACSRPYPTLLARASALICALPARHSVHSLLEQAAYCTLRLHSVPGSLLWAGSLGGGLRRAALDGHGRQQRH